jgi:hypothetical protein
MYGSKIDIVSAIAMAVCLIGGLVIVLLAMAGMWE